MEIVLESDYQDIYKICEDVWLCIDKYFLAVDDTGEYISLPTDIEYKTRPLHNLSNLEIIIDDCRDSYGRIVKAGTCILYGDVLMPADKEYWQSRLVYM